MSIEEFLNQQDVVDSEKGEISGTACRGDRRSGRDSLLSRLRSGEKFALGFGGQGTAWLAGLSEISLDADLESELTQLVTDAEALLVPVRSQLDIFRPEGFQPMRWVRNFQETAGDDTATAAKTTIPKNLASAALSMPGILLTQIAAMQTLEKQGLNFEITKPTALVGHSQGAVAAELVGEKPVDASKLLAYMQILGAVATSVAGRYGLCSDGEGSPMLSVTDSDPKRIQRIVQDYARTLASDEKNSAPVVSIKNGRRSVVISGAPKHLRALIAVSEELAAQELADRKRKLAGGAAFSPKFEFLDVTIGFHHPTFEYAVNTIMELAVQCGIEAQWAQQMARIALVDNVDWVADIESVVDADIRWVLDLGPHDVVTKLTVPIVRGQEIGVIPVSLRSGQRNLFTPGSIPQVGPAWTSFAPKVVELASGQRVISTSFTCLTGRSPILLAGMTPTTVDPKIVAAAANAGHWAELAGGGQVTEEIFSAHIAELTELLEPGRQAQFNALFLDPYLWKLQLGGKRLVQKARSKGAPLDGVIVTAGIPELDDAVELIDELRSAGLPYIAFKPGTVDQIRQVIRIAAEVSGVPIIIQIEGGKAGGHHSWEDLDDLLLATYAELRGQENLVICVGGGIGTPARASEYLTGIWSRSYGYPTMPLDGILVGTAAMAAKEATTSEDVKQLLVDTPGVDEWIGAGHSASGMASGRSQLGADIHEIDNAASRAGRLLDEVAGDEEAVASRRGEIIEAISATAKPYFGDLSEMTYQVWLQRYLELAVGNSDSSSITWLDSAWQERFMLMLQRTEARLHRVDSGEIESLFTESSAVENPYRAITTLVAHYPQTAETLLHPAEEVFFLELAKLPGKPVNFVPVIDKDVRRWWRSDSLWQAHDSRYTADQVCIIPGPVAVAGITQINEPIGQLLNRFEAQIVSDVVSDATEIPRIYSRKTQGQLGSPGILTSVIEAETISWAGRITANPIALLGDSTQWVVISAENATHASGAALVATATGAVLTVPVSGTQLDIEFTVSEALSTGGVPAVSTNAAVSAMSALLAHAAGGKLESVSNGSVTITTEFDPQLIADHAAATAFSLPPRLGATFNCENFANPDVLVGLCWPAVFSVIGSAVESGVPVVEGLLSLVHLDHTIKLLAPIPSVRSSVSVTAQLVSVERTEVGNTIEVAVEIFQDSQIFAQLVERFAVRGRSGGAELADPVRAGNALTTQAHDTVRKKIRQLKIKAPQSMLGFASVSGDHNPIHTDILAAKLAGLAEPIVHGMWLSAAAQHAVTARDAKNPTPIPLKLHGWTARFVGMVLPGDEIDLRVDRVGTDRGGDILEITAKVGDTLVLAASAVQVAPRTVYAFPGQGIQSKGMGLDARSRSKAARAIWDRADSHTRAALGFSILAVVRDNPTILVAGGTTYQHPDGVLYLTQFTQVAMATLGVAQIAELEENGGLVDDAITCGHSVGEYNALAAFAKVLPLEAVLEVVFQRGEAMHHLVPRDELGRSNYRLAAIRPSQFGLADDEVTPFVTEISTAAGEFLEVVNLNLLGSQYAIAGTVRGLEQLEKEIDRRRAEFGGKRAFIVIPGIDVPFHSSVLREGVPAFRERLDALLPAEIAPEILVGRYIPNLVPQLFNLSEAFIQEIADLVPSEPLDAVLADFSTWAASPAQLTRIVLIELLAWQFASPVRWIETQELLFTPESRGGLGIERFVEVGVKGAPTLAGLATNTLKLGDYHDAYTQVVNLERDNEVVLARDPGVDDDFDELPESNLVESHPVESASAQLASEVVAAPVIPVSESGARPADLTFLPADAVTSVIALWTKMRPEQIGTADTIEALCDGVSSRRNQLLLDVGAELNLGAIDGASDADMSALAASVNSLARGYKAFGPVLTDAIADQIRKVFGPLGKRLGFLEDRVRNQWQLGEGWVLATTIAVALGTREGASVRGGELANLSGGVTNVEALEQLIDAAVLSVGSLRGVAVAKPAAANSGGGAVVDAGALAEFTEQLTGPDGALASAANVLLAKLGLGQQNSVDLEDSDETTEILLQRVEAELGSDWQRTVAPAFDERRAVLFDDRWATARDDLARIWLLEEDLVDDEFKEHSAAYVSAGDTLAAHATWWQGKALAVGKLVHAHCYAEIAHAAQIPDAGIWGSEIAVVTGASVGSIAAAVVAQLLGGGAKVIATTSQLTPERVDFFKKLYRENASSAASLWVVPANMAAYADVDALVAWIGSEQTENLGATTGVVKPAYKPTLLFPFAAPRVVGDLTDAGPRAEIEMKVLLWSVERLIAGLGEINADHDLESRLHTVLPGSPNRGMFGGDGAYGEAKASLDALVARWKAEGAWNEKVTLAHVLIGWVRGTGLMGHNDGMVSAIESAGIKTWATEEMASELLATCTPESRSAAKIAPIERDCTAGLNLKTVDLPALMKAAAEEVPIEKLEAEEINTALIPALPSIPPVGTETAISHQENWQWGDVAAKPEDLVVIVGAGELGPYGSARTRFEMEVSNQLSASGVVELAWSTGVISWEQTPKPGWYDATSGELVPEEEIADRYHDEVVERCGIRRYVDDNEMVNNAAPLLVSVFLDNDLTFSVGSEADARAFKASVPEKTAINCDEQSGEWLVTRLAGTEIRVPREMKLTRTVGGQLPTGFDPARWGISADMVESVDRVALWNLVTTVDAFLSSGFEPAELLRWVHPGLVANTQGTGMGGMASMRSLYIDTLLGESRANDILQEALPNVVAAHVVQSYIGSYGAMVHPVAACATAAVSVEEGVDKIKLGKALFAVAGGFDDLGVAGIIGFGDMSATAVSATMAEKGISERYYSRANDRRRSGFVESQGGGTILLARGDIAAEFGLPVLGVVAHAESFGDGVHTSIPAPGLGALGAIRGGEQSRLARSLADLNVSADDVAVISKHDTSTRANDPNEANLHERLAAGLGRSEGAPLFVISQKTLTGHAKGGAAAFQIIGLCQVLASGVIPPNRSLDCVDPVMEKHEHLVWPTQPIEFGASFPLKAGLITSLGFGHVSGLLAIVHPEAFVAALPEAEREEYQRQAAARVAAGSRRILDSMYGGKPAYQRPPNRRFVDNHQEPLLPTEAEQEAAMLIASGSRLTAAATYGTE